MSKRIYKELLSLNNNGNNNNNNGDMANFIAETCLNNIFQVLNLISKYQNQDTENISKLLNNDPQLVTKYTSGRKLVSIDILNCENIEDKKGNPLNMFVEILGPINGKTRMINRDYNPQWNESFDSIVNKNSKNLIINVIYDEKKLDTQPQIYKSIKYDLGLNSVDDYYSKEDKISLEPRPGNLNIEITIQSERHDSVQYILNAIQRIHKLKDRSIKLFVESYSNPYKTLFNKNSLEKSLNINKIQETSNKKIFNINLDRNLIYDDSIIHDYIFKLEGETFTKLYNNLETNCFDDVILQLYKNIISIAINLILPRLSSVDHKITSRLNKRSSLTNRIFSSSSSSSSSSPSPSYSSPSTSHGFTSSQSLQDIQNANSSSLEPLDESYLSSKSGMYVSNNQEIRRVFEWIQTLTNCFFDNTEVLPQPLIPIYERVKKIWYNYQIDNKNLKTNYFNSWKLADKYIIKNCVNRRINHSFNFNKNIKFDYNGRIIKDDFNNNNNNDFNNNNNENDKMEDVMNEREIILRIILLKSGGSGSDYKFVVNSLEQIQRYKRSIETELEYEILVGRF
ncbi:hypothetical protein B5S31_g5666 [[Candida] boidinii]|nr:hypothetical protein B5S31_g5666 [[Candida] boidinii]